MSSFSFLLPSPINTGFSDFAGFFISGFMPFKISLEVSNSGGGQRPQVSVSKIRAPLSLQREVFEGSVGFPGEPLPAGVLCAHSHLRRSLYPERCNRALQGVGVQVHMGGHGALQCRCLLRL